MFSRISLDREQRPSYRAVVTAAYLFNDADGVATYYVDSAEIDIGVDDVKDRTGRPCFYSQSTTIRSDFGRMTQSFPVTWSHGFELSTPTKSSTLGSSSE